MAQKEVTDTGTYADRMGVVNGGITKLYCVAITKAQYDTYIEPLSGEGPKLLMHFSAPSLTTSEIKFDLAIYIARNHAHYAQDVTPFLAKTTTACTQVEADKQYIFNNNDKSIRELKLFLEGRIWTSLLLTPRVDKKRQVYFELSTVNDTGGSNFLSSKDSTEALKRLKDFKALSTTNPSPPRQPA